MRCTVLPAFNAFAAEYQPETAGSSDIYLDIPEVVTEYNKQYNYTASVDKNNGGGFLTTRDYKGVSTSDSAKSHLNSSYIQFSASLTTSDVTCSNTKLSFAQPVPNPNEVHPLPTLQAYTADTYFDCLNVTLGKCYDSKISAEKAAVPFGRQLFCVSIR